MNTNIRKNIATIVDYNWADEERNYAECMPGNVPGTNSREGHIFQALMAVRAWLESPQEKTWTRDEIGRALNTGANLVVNDPDLGLSGSDQDLVNLVVNAIGSVLDNPGTTLDEAIEESYGEDPETVKGWIS